MSCFIFTKLATSEKDKEGGEGKKQKEGWVIMRQVLYYRLIQGVLSSMFRCWGKKHWIFLEIWRFGGEEGRGGVPT